MGVKVASPGSVVSSDDLDKAVYASMAARSGQLKGLGISEDALRNLVWSTIKRESGGGSSPKFITIPRTNFGKGDSHATGIGQFQPGFITGYNLRNPKAQVDHKAIMDGEVSAAKQVDIIVDGLLTLTQTVQQDYKSVLDKSHQLALADMAYRIGAGGTSLNGRNEGVKAVVVRELGSPSLLNDINYDKVYPAIQQSNNRQQGITAHAKDYQGEAAPDEATAAQSVRLRLDTKDVTPVDAPRVIDDGLDETPWWALENAVTGNPALQRIPPAISFRLVLDSGTGSVLSDKDGAPLEIRLVTGVKTFSTGSTQSNSVHPTATALLLNVWEGKPDMITVTGTTGVFMNQGGLTSLMSHKGSPLLLRMLLRNSTYNGIGGDWSGENDVKNRFRVAAQDAFIELLSLFKHNGTHRFTPMQQRTVQSARNEAAWSAAAGLTGYQMRSRAGDVLGAGYVEMVYKGRVMRGMFKTFEWTANAESPYRWDFSFTFRVMEDFTPYIMGV